VCPDVLPDGRHTGHVTRADVQRRDAKLTNRGRHVQVLGVEAQGYADSQALMSGNDQMLRCTSSVSGIWMNLYIVQS